MPILKLKQDRLRLRKMRELGLQKLQKRKPWEVVMEMAEMVMEMMPLEMMPIKMMNDGMEIDG